MKTIAIISKTPWALEIQERMSAFSKKMSEEKQKIYEDVHVHLIADGHIKADSSIESYNVCFDPDSDAVTLGDCTQNPFEGFLHRFRQEMK